METGVTVTLFLEEKFQTWWRGGVLAVWRVVVETLEHFLLECDGLKGFVGGRRRECGYVTWVPSGELLLFGVD